MTVPFSPVLKAACRHLIIGVLFSLGMLIIWLTGYTNIPESTSCQINAVIPSNGLCTYNVTILVTPAVLSTVRDNCLPGYNASVVETCYYLQTGASVAWSYSYNFAIATFFAVVCTGTAVINFGAVGYYLIVYYNRRTPDLALRSANPPGFNELDAFSTDGPTHQPHPPLYETAVTMVVIGPPDPLAPPPSYHVIMSIPNASQPIVQPL